MSDDNVVMFNGATTLDYDADVMLRRALKAGLEGVVILGYKKDGNGFFASSISDGGSVLWLLESFKKDLLAVGD